MRPLAQTSGAKARFELQKYRAEMQVTPKLFAQQYSPSYLGFHFTVWFFQACNLAG